MYDFITNVSRENTSAVKVNADEIKTYFGLNCYEDTIFMWVADMDFACAPEIVDAIKARADKLIFGYTNFSDEYLESIINWYKRRHDMDIKKEHILFSNGTVPAIRDTIKTFTQEGEGVIIQTPVYYPFEREIRLANRQTVNNELMRDENNIYHLDFVDFEKKCEDPNNTLFILCNPHNPTGNIWTKDEVQKMLEICHKNNVMVFADEIHCDLIRKDSEFTSALNLDYSDDIIVATAVNKTFNVAGLHVTNLVMRNPEHKQKLIEKTGMKGLSPFALEATIAAYNKAEGWVQQLNEVLDDNFDYMDKFIEEHLPKVKFVKPQGTYLAWLDFSAYGIKGDELVAKIADEAHIILEDGAIFGECGEGFVRMNVACPKSVLIDALNRLKKLSTGICG
ncbi:MAG: aminotransferase [Epulopiscium sp. Nele67-Bin004]|nr:MAG: aminotransferase [Epulopiscium sp. Nele67-Bin004]